MTSFPSMRAKTMRCRSMRFPTQTPSSMDRCHLRISHVHDAHKPRPEPRYLRFLAAIVLGSAAVVTPVALGGCEDDSVPVDAAPPDSDELSVDGPLQPPDLPRRA